MGLNNLGLGFLFTGTDLVSGTMARIRGNFGGLEEQAGTSIAGVDRHLTRLAGGLAVAATGAGALMAAFGLASQAEQFELAIAQVGAVSGATAEELEQLKEAAIQAGISTQFTPEEATFALNELAQAGFSTKESIDLLGPALDLAAGSLGQLSPAEAAGVAAQGLKAFGIETGLAKVAVDQMLQASNAFAMRADDLPLALGIAARGAQSFNQSLTETIIAVGLVKNVIPGTERAATSVAVAMERMVKADTQKALRRIGVQVVDAEGNFREFLSILQDLQPELDKMSEAERGRFLQETFGAESLAGLNAIMSQVTTGIRTNTGETVRGAKAIAFLRDQFRGANGVADEFSRKLLDTAAGQKKLLTGSLQTLAVVMGESFSQALRPVVEVSIRLVNALIDVVKRTPKPIKMLIVGMFLFAAAALVVVGGLITLGAVWPLLVAGIALAKAAFLALAGATLAAAAPLLPFIAAAIAVGGAVYLLSGDLGLAGKAMLAVGAAAAAFFVFPRIVAMVMQLGAAFKMLGLAMAANPLGVIIAALAAVVLLVVGIRNNWLGLRDAFVVGIDVIADKLEFLKGPLEFFKDLVAGKDPMVEQSSGPRSIDAQLARERAYGGAAPRNPIVAEEAAEDAASAAPQQPGIVDQAMEALGGLGQVVPAMALPPAPAGTEGAPLAEPALQAAAEVAAEGEKQKAPPIDYARLGAALGQAVERRPLHAVLQVDGEAIAAATAGAERSRRERAGELVPAEAP